MSRFTFKLESLLEHRRSVERQRQRDLACAKRDAMLLEHQLRQASDAAAATASPVRAGAGGPVQAHVLLAHARFAAAMREKVANLQKQLDGVRQRSDAAQAALTEAAKGRKVLEKLRENQQAQWAAEQQRADERAAEEIAQRAAAASAALAPAPFEPSVSYTAFTSKSDPSRT